MRTLYYTKAEKSILKFLSDIYELGREVKISKNDKDYIVNSYSISKALLAKSIGLHPQTISNAITNLSDKKIIKYEPIIINNSVKGSILYFNSDLYLHPEQIGELSDILDNLNEDTANNGLFYKKIKGFDINSLLSSKYKELDTDNKEDIEVAVEPIKEELRRDRSDMNILYKMFLKQNKAIMKSLDLIAEQNKALMEQNKAVVKSLDLLSEAIGKIGSVGTISEIIDKSTLNNPKADDELQFTMVDKEFEEKSIMESIENNEPTESAESVNNSGLVIIPVERQTVNGKEVITIEPKYSIVDAGPDIDTYLYENDEEYAKEVAGIKDRDDITYQDLDYFRYLKNISNNFYNRFYNKAPRGNYIHGLQFLSDLLCYRYSIGTDMDKLIHNFRHIDKEGWVTYYLLNHDGYVKKVVNDLPIKPESVDVGKIGLVINYSENIPNVAEVYNYKLNFDFCYKKFYLGDGTNDKSNVTLLDYESMGQAIGIYSLDKDSAISSELKKHTYDIDYSKKHILLKFFYLSLKRSQNERVGDFRLGRNSYYENKEGKLIMHKTTWLIINKVDYQPFVKQLLIDYTEWCCGGGAKWREEIEKYIIPKKRVSTRRVYNGLKNGLPEYDIEYIESELLDGHLIRRIYEKMMDGNYKKGYCLGLNAAGLGKAVKKDIPAYKTDTQEYEDLFYRFIGLRKTGFGYCSMKGIIPVAKNDVEYYENIIEERIAVLTAYSIYNSVGRAEIEETDRKEKAKIWQMYIPYTFEEISFDELMGINNFLEDEDDLTLEEKEYISSYPNLVLSIIHNTSGNYYSLSTLKNHIREKLDFLRKELKNSPLTYGSEESDKLGLKSYRDIKKIANNLNEIQKKYI